MRFRTVLLGERRLAEYAGLAEPEVLDGLRERARTLAGLRVLHLTADPFGRNVADTLTGLVPLLRDLGISTDWQVLENAPQICDTVYLGLAGYQAQWTTLERSQWHRYLARCAANLSLDYDVVVVHDSQLLALPRQIGARRPIRWLWHCHVDAGLASRAIESEAKQALRRYEGALFPTAALAREDFGLLRVGVGRPALDPFAEVNLPLALSAIGRGLAELRIDCSRPIVAQFAPLQPGYGPLAVMEAFTLARRQVRGLQLALVEPPQMAMGGAWREVDEVLNAAGGDPDIHVLPFEVGLGAAEVNALQRGASAILQLGVPTGFGWSLLESQWKRKPVIVGSSGQLPEQVGDGETGIIVDGPSDAAEALVDVLREPGLALHLGERGHRRVLDDHLITALARDYLDLLAAAASAPIRQKGDAPLTLRAREDAPLLAA